MGQTRMKLFTEALEPHLDNMENAFKLSTREIDHYKQLLREEYELGRYSYGMYRNMMSAINSFATYILSRKKQAGEIYYEDVTQVRMAQNTSREVTPYVLVTEQDIESYLKDLSLNVKWHTFQVYSFYLRQALDEILDMSQRGELSDYVNISKVFSKKKYKRGKHLYPIKRQRTSAQKRKLLLNKYKEYENLKSVTIESIIDALAYLRILGEKISKREARMNPNTFNEVKVATALLLFTGARSTELATLLVQDINFRENYILITRNKLSEDDIKHRTTVFPLHPFLKAILKWYIKEYQLDWDDYLLGTQYLDKKISYAFRPRAHLRLGTDYITINGKRYSTTSPIITVRKFRKFWDNYAEANGMDFRIKNYLLGRKVGIDIEYYVSVLKNPKVFLSIQKEYSQIFGDLDKLLNPVIKEVFKIKI